MTANGFRVIKRGKWPSYELDGSKPPSVTKLIGDGCPKPALIGWAAREAAEFATDNLDTIARLDRDAAVDMIKAAPDRAKRRGGLRGTEVHGLAQQLAAGEPVDVPLDARGYVDAYIAFLTEWAVEVLLVETAVASRRWWYAGRFDLLARLATLGATLIDVKTGGSGIWPETALQLAAYRHAEVYLDAKGKEQPMPAVAACCGLWLHDDGTYELVPVDAGAAVFESFLHVAFVAAFTGRPKDDVVQAPLAVPVLEATS